MERPIPVAKDKKWYFFQPLTANKRKEALDRWYTWNDHDRFCVFPVSF